MKIGYKANKTKTLKENTFSSWNIGLFDVLSGTGRFFILVFLLSCLSKEE